MSSERLAVRKTYKLWIGGAFVRSESGALRTAPGEVNIPRASRKDVRDAVAAARKAFGPWSARTAYNRGQILYRAAEALESRRDQLAAVSDLAQVDAAVDVLVHYAGWTDKFQAVLGGINPVAAPFLSFSLPEPTGVVGVVAPDAARAARPRRRGRARPGRGQHRRRDPLGVSSRWPGWTWPRCSASPTSRAASSTCSPAGAPSWPPRSAPTAT